MEWNAGFNTSGLVAGAKAGQDALRALREEAERAAGALGGTEKAGGAAGDQAKRTRRPKSPPKPPAEQAGGAAGEEARRQKREQAEADKASRKKQADDERAAKRAAATEEKNRKYVAAIKDRYFADEQKKGERADKEAERAKKAAETKAAKAADADKKKAESDKKKQADDAKAKKKDADDKADKLKVGSLKALGAAGAVAAIGVGLVAKAYGSLLGLAGRATGIGSFGELTQLAIGMRSTAQLQAIAIRTNMSVRRMFMGVDSTPLVRAQERFSRNFTEQTVTGRALGDILVRAYSGAFRMVERLEPLATGAIQGMVLGALKVEGAWLRLQLAAIPIVTPIYKAVKGVDALQLAADLAVAPFEKIADDLERIEKLIAAFEKMRASGFTRQPLDVLMESAVQNSGGGEKEAARVRKGGEGVGKAMADGMVAGMDAAAGSVAAAGGRLAKAAEQGAKDAAEIKSPARRFRREVGRQMGRGTVFGLEDEAPSVQRAAASALVPDPTGLSFGRGAGGGSVSGPLLVIEHLVVQGADGLDEVTDRFESLVERAAETLGLRVPARS